METKPGIFSFSGPSMPVVHLKSGFLAIKQKYVGQPLTKSMREELYQELEILFDRFDLKDLQLFIKQKKEDPHTIEIIPVRTIDKWALKGILLTDEISDEDIKMNESNFIDTKSLEVFYNDYDNWCSNMHYGGFYIEWLTRNEFMERIKTYSDLKKIQIESGMIDEDTQ